MPVPYVVVPLEEESISNNVSFPEMVSTNSFILKVTVQWKAKNEKSFRKTEKLCLTLPPVTFVLYFDSAAGKLVSNC